MSERKSIDWIQFGILLCAIVTLIVGTVYYQGKILQAEEDQARQLEQFGQRLSNVESQLERIQALTPGSPPARFKQ